MNPQVGKQFNQNENKEKENEVDEEENDETELRVKKENLMFQMSRKSLGKALLNFEIKQELKETNSLNKVKFGPLKTSGKNQTFKETKK